jgi:hypothetical protein
VFAGVTKRRVTKVMSQSCRFYGIWVNAAKGAS